MNLDDCSELAEIIQQIDVADRIPSQPRSKDREDMLRAVNELAQAGSETIEQIIDRLKQDPSGVLTEFVDRKPYISIALAYAYCICNEGILAQKCAQEAKDQFGRSKSEWNKAVAHWFLGIVYRNNGQTGKGQAELEQASRIFSNIWKSLSKVAKVRRDYDVTHLCKRQVEKIKTALSDLPDYMARGRVAARLAIPYEVFSRIIGFLEIPQDELHNEWKEAICSLDPFDKPYIDEQIKILKRLLGAPEESRPIATSFIYLFLAHCYNLLASSERQDAISYAMKYTREAIAAFQALLHDRNQAIAYWYHALLLQNILDTKNSIAQLENSNRLINSALESNKDKDQFKRFMDLQNNIQFWINKLNSANVADKGAAIREDRDSSKGVIDRLRRFVSPRITGPDSTPLTTHSLTIKRAQLRPTLDNKQKTPTEAQPIRDLPKIRSRKPGSVFHITIPVDADALMDLKRDTKTLDENLFNRLREYNRDDSGQIRPNQDAQTNRNEATNKPRFIIPPCPIYGRVSAGPEGKVAFEEPEYANGVSREYQVAFFEVPHRVYSAKERDNQITISENKEYGWLKVDGESMNITSPVPIDDQDYVLFFKTDDLRACDGKIVIASHSGLEEQPPRIMVKRLKSKPINASQKRFYLHSDSSLEVYNIDIPVTDDDQLIGEVIAVAKPKK